MTMVTDEEVERERIRLLDVAKRALSAASTVAGGPNDRDVIFGAIARDKLEALAKVEAERDEAREKLAAAEARVKELEAKHNAALTEAARIVDKHVCPNCWQHGMPSDLIHQLKYGVGLPAYGAKDVARLVESAWLAASKAGAQ
jgi:hypothetical protein